MTHSSGNHAQAVAMAARLCGYEAQIVMPKGSLEVKKQGVIDFGAKITFCENVEQVYNGNVSFTPHEIVLRVWLSKIFCVFDTQKYF